MSQLVSIDQAKNKYCSVENLEKQIKWASDSLDELKPLVQEYKMIEYYKKELEEIKEKILEEQENNSLPF